MKPIIENDSHIAFLCTIQQLGPRYAGLKQDEHLFELVVTPAAYFAAAPLPAHEFYAALTWFLRAGQAVDTLRIAVEYEAASPRVFKEAPVLTIDVGATDPPDADGVLRNHLSTVLGQESSGDELTALAGFSWTPAGQPNQSAIPASGSEALRGRFSKLLASVSSLPAPLPQRLSLSFLFKLKLDPARALHRVFAAPMFGTWGPIPATPTDSEFSSTGAAAVWKYAPDPSDATRPLAYAYCGSYALPSAAPASSEQRIDLTSLWVRQLSSADSDWTAQLRTNVGAYFDLPQRLIDALRRDAGPDWLVEHSSSAGASNSRKAIAWLRDAIVASLRDLAGGSAALSLFHTALRQSVPEGGAVDPAAEKQAVSELASFEAKLTLEQWRKLLIGAVPEAAGVRALSAVDAFEAERDWKDELGELERLQAAARNATATRRIVFKLWSEALAGNALWAARKEAILKHLEGVDVAAVCARALLESKWRQIIDVQRDGDSSTEHRRLETNVAAALAGYFDERLPATPTSNLTPKAELPLGALRDRLRRELESAARDHIAKWIESFGAPAATEFRSTPRPHGVAFQIDRLGARPKSSSSAGNEDYLRRVAGVVALMRPVSAGSGGWRYLNAAQLEFARSDGKLTLLSRALVPSRMSYSDGLRQVFLTYDNQPLIARSPLASTTSTYLASASVDGVPEQAARGDSLLPVRYAPLVPSADDKWSRLPMLKFGETYEIAAFVTTNSGALPAGIAGAHPCVAKDPETIVDADVPEPRLVVRYQRRVPVSSPRVDRGAASDARPQLPAIPKDTKPLARELNLPHGSGQPGDRRNEAQLPLLLIGDSKTFERVESQYSLSLRLPSVDLETWERWVARDSSDATVKLRKDVRRRHIQLLDANAALERAGSPQDKLADLSIDDPAAASKLLVELVLLRSADAAQQIGAIESLEVAVPTAAARSIPAVQRGAAKVRIEYEPTGAAPRLAPGATDSEVVVRIAPGQIFELRVFALARVAEFGPQGRFPENYPDAWKSHSASDGASYRRLSPLRMLIEGVSNAMPSPSELWTALEPTLTANGLEVALSKAAARFDNVQTLEVRRQLWRWDGRPSRWDSSNPAPFPPNEAARDPQPGGAPTQTMAWESWAFSGRGAFDYSQHAHELSLAQATREVVYRERIEPSSPARFYRFTAVAISRYAGLSSRPDDEKLGLMVRASSVDDAKDANATPWRRLHAPCTRVAAPSRPRVRLVVPMTESERSAQEGALSSAGLAPLMVVLDEPWFEEGGLGEELEAQIVKVGYGAGGSTPIQRSQYGSDPILTAAMTPEPWEDAPELNVIGPIGTTFDTDTDAPRFVTSMFVIRPSFAAGKPSRPPVWPMAKIRFKRSIPPAESSWTDGYWTQFLPDSRALEAWNVARNAELAWSEDAAGNASLSGVGLRRETPQPDETGASHSSRLLLVTRVVHDAHGRFGDESYVGVFRVDASGRNALALDLSAQARGDNKPVGEARVRVIEVQWPGDKDPFVAADGAAAEDLWSVLFGEPAAEPSDLRARIVRVTTYTQALLR